jgi:hypothetical protein
VAAFGTIRATPAQLVLLRQQTASAGIRPLPPALLKHADEQTVAAVTALGEAVRRFHLAATRFTDWGVLAAPRFLGRTAMLAAVQRFAAEGAWGISPHLIPHRSLHSLSGTISQALAIHGPNFGVGGGLDGASEIFLTVSGLLERERLPGVWLVLTGWDPEPQPGREDNPAVPTCNAVALALTAAGTAMTGWRFCIRPAACEQKEAANTPLLSLEALATDLAEAGRSPVKTCWRLADGGRLELERGVAARLAG